MRTSYQNSLFIFRRDLRLDDNTGLIAALNQSKKVHPIFIYDPRQVGKHNTYKSSNALQFMLESLHELKKAIKKRRGTLQEFYGVAETVVADIITENKIDAVFFNNDYTPFARKRDQLIEQACLKNKIACHRFDDALLHAPNTISNKMGTPYLIFTPFFKHARTLVVQAPHAVHAKNFAVKKLQSRYKKLPKIVVNKNSMIAVHGGPTYAKKILDNLEPFNNYAKTRNLPALNGTTKLSASNKFGTISIRTVYHTLRAELGANDLITQLFWRDFFTHVAYHFPGVFKQAFKEKFRTIPWRTNKKDFKRWCSGTTSFPLVDAGMRELNTTGFMHNRVRMVAASFLVKDLRINWQWGERYFAQKLVDYDPAINNGNWQWIASCGADAQPPFRILNPWIQQKRFDYDCVYIKQWVPELRDIAARDIQRWQTSYQKHKTAYPAPMLDHRAKTTRTNAMR